MKQFVVIGLGRFGASVARTLAKKGCDVLAIDCNGEKVQAVAGEVTHAVEADATDENTMRTLGIGNFDVAIISIGADVHSSILATLVVKEMGVGYVVVKAQTELHGKVFAKLGADKIVYPERDMGVRVANNLISTNVLDLIELTDDYTIVEVVASQKMIGHTLVQLEFRNRFGNVIAIRNGDQINVAPQATDELREGDVLIVVGKNEDLERLNKV